MEEPRDRRIRVKAPVSFEGQAGVGRGTVFNISLTGCALESTASVKMDSTIRLDLHIPTDKKPVKVGRARVIWTAGEDIGIEFIKMDQTGKARLQQFIDNLVPKKTSKTGKA